MTTKVVLRGAAVGGKQWGSVVYCVERDLGDGEIEFHRYSDKDEALADAAEDTPTHRWELVTDETAERDPGWRL